MAYFSVVQSAVNAQANSSGIAGGGTFSFASNVTLGNLIVVLASVRDNGGAPSASSGWNVASSQDFSQLGCYQALYYRYVQAGDTTSFNYDTTNRWSYFTSAWEITGIHGNWAQDFNQASFGKLGNAATGPYASGSITPTHANDLILFHADVQTSGAGATNFTSSFTNLTQDKSQAFAQSGWFSGTTSFSTVMAGHLNPSTTASISSTVSNSPNLTNTFAGYGFADLGSTLVESSVGSSTGHATNSGAGVGHTSSAGVVSARSSVIGAGVGVARLRGSSSGSSTVLGHGLSEDEGVGSSLGKATVTATGAGLTHSEGSSDGVSTLEGHGLALSISKGRSVGSATVSGVGVGLATAVGDSRGHSSVRGKLFLSPSITGMPVGQLWWKKVHTPPRSVVL